MGKLRADRERRYREVSGITASGLVVEKEDKAKDSRAILESSVDTMGLGIEWDKIWADRERRDMEASEAVTKKDDKPKDDFGIIEPSPRPKGLSIVGTADGGCESESSGSYYELDMDLAGKAEQAPEHLARRHLGAPLCDQESWTTSPENAIEASSEISVQSIGNILENSPSAGRLSPSVMTKMDLSSNPFDDGTDVSSLRSQETTGLCTSAKRDITPNGVFGEVSVRQPSTTVSPRRDTVVSERADPLESKNGLALKSPSAANL